ncbi:hypothetical protein SAMD00020551_1307 [Mesobacillus selenatarsenatis SF-1]|uniref:Uncharacterized protein n=1 Tax=Mesobacillus selenatarsenatis (strain DSM 18680 / JCM 14380 / FERM P-15431 / SF-1) TaxID=1321606 RepID=A0A0A8X1M0_MESS1|nr:hypothetical protein SAMD00020551_1307 [Mesobacillus selenatarsenatis SF-1]
MMEIVEFSKRMQVSDDNDYIKTVPSKITFKGRIDPNHQINENPTDSIFE